MIKITLNLTNGPAGPAGPAGPFGPGGHVLQGPAVATCGGLLLPGAPLVPGLPTAPGSLKIHIVAC